MKYFLLFTFFLCFFGCRQNADHKGTSFLASNDCDVYLGEWTGTSGFRGQVQPQVFNIIVTENGPNYLIEIENPLSGIRTGYFGALVCEDGILKDDGKTTIIYVRDGEYCLIYGDKFFRGKSDMQNTSDVEIEEEETSKESTLECAPSKYKIIIEGNDVRIRSEPDTKADNVIVKLNKGVETVYIGELEIDGQKWYKVCYKTQIGWVSGQFASLHDQNSYEVEKDKFSGIWNGKEEWLTIMKLSDGSYKITREDIEENSFSYAGRLENGKLKYTDPNENNVVRYIVVSSSNCLKDGYYEFCKK